MLRIHLIQNWNSLSDEAMENELIDIPCIRRFAGIDLVTDNIPDATIIHAPTSTKNRKKERPGDASDPQGEPVVFWHEVHIGLDKDSGLIHSVAATSANIHDVTMAAELLHGEEKVVYGDAGYQGLHKREEMAGRDVDCRIAMRPGKCRRLCQEDPEEQLLHWEEQAKAHIRAKVEHPFRVIKQQFGFQKTRLRGMAKNHFKMMILDPLTNLFLARNRLLATAA